LNGNGVWRRKEAGEIPHCKGGVDGTSRASEWPTRARRPKPV